MIYRWYDERIMACQAYFNARDGSELIVDSIAVDARAQQDKQQ